jgi:hypothetical protein
MSCSIARRWALWLFPLSAVTLLICCSTSVADETVQVCGSYANNVFAASSVPGIATTGRCPAPSYNGGGFGLFNTGTTTRGQTGRWQTTTPAGLELVGVTASQLVSYGVNDGQDYGGGFYWAGGGTGTNDHSPSTLGMVFSSPSSYFGMQLVCGRGRCTAPAQLDVGAFSLYVRETSGPSLVAPVGLWQASGWVRGMWPFFAWGNSPSGLCWLSASLNGQLINTTTSAQDVSTWHQCAAPPISQSVDTTRYGQGALPLTLSAGDAAGVPAGVNRTVYIDNSVPVVSFSGPSDAPTTAGTQSVAAAAGGSPSGIDGLACSLDGGPSQWYGGSSARIAVSGIGDHTVRCAAANNAVDGAGNHGWSNWATWSLSIREPTVSGIGFARLVHALLCHRVRERVMVPPRWVTVRRHHRLVRVKMRAHTKVVTVTRCHARVVRRRITVWTTVLRHGRTVRVKRHKTIRIVEFPHVVYHNSKWVRHGKRVTVSGWLGTPDGTALAGQDVHLLTAPDNGIGRFSQAAVAITAANGTWSTRLRAGPSRLVEAYYAGAPTLETSVSSQVHVVVPAKVKLISVFPRRVPWGGTVRIVGQLVGGYLPPGGALVRLRIGYGSSYTTYGVQEHVTGNGRFSATYTFGLGDPNVYRSYWFQIASLPMGDYPWAPGTSSKRSVLVGGHPAIPRPPAHHRHKHRRHRRHRKR